MTLATPHRARAVPHPAVTSPTALPLIAATLVALCAPAGYAIAQDRPLDGDFPEVYRLGGLNAPTWAQFDDPTQLGFDASGNLYLLDRGAMHVVVADRTGELVATVGRQGDGPGELQAPTDLVVWRDGRFLVADVMHGAYQVFRPDGTLDRFIRMSSTPGLASMAAARNTIRADPQGDALIAEGPGMAALASALVADRSGAGQLDASGEHGKLERLDLGGEYPVAEPIARARRIPPDNPDADRPYFAPVVTWDVLPDGTIAYFDSTIYSITLVGADGSRKGMFERAIQPETMTPAIRSAVIEHLLEAQEQRNAALSSELAGLLTPDMMEAGQERARAKVRRTEFFPEIPVLRGLRATWEGSLWVRRRGEEPWDNRGPIDVVGPDLQYRGTFAAGDPMPMAFGPEGLVAYLEKDELGVPTIVVKRLAAQVR